MIACTVKFFSGGAYEFAEMLYKKELHALQSWRAFNVEDKQSPR